jgi:hypothetical protein
MKYFLLYLLFLQYFSSIHVTAFIRLSFLKNIDFHSQIEHLQNMNIKNIEDSSLEKIISNQMFLNTLYNEIKNNVFDCEYLIYILNNNSQILLFSLFLLFIIINSNDTIITPTKKIDKIKVDKTQVKKISFIKYNIKRFIFVFMVIFTKDINSVL